MSHHPRQLALNLLIAIEKQGAYSNLALNDLPKNLDPRDRALVVSLVQGVTRMRRMLDAILGQLLAKTSLAALKPPIRNNLRMGAYQLLCTDIPAHAVLDEAVKLARRFGHEGVSRLTNGVLRNLQRQAGDRKLDGLAFPEAPPITAIGTRNSLPDWIIRRWVDQFGMEEASALAQSANQPQPLTLRVNRLRTTRQAFLDRLAALDIAAEASPVDPDGVRLTEAVPLTRLPGYNDGDWYVQGEAAMLVSRIVDPRPGETIADVGAAPGGKTTHLAALMNDQGRILALDAHEGRLGVLAENTRRLRVTSVEPRVHDGTAPTGEPVNRSLVDAPCSGFGVMYRKADLRWRAKPAEVDALPMLQRRILDAAAQDVLPGGVLVYATCTVNRAENQDVVRGFLQDHPEFAASDLTRYLPEAWRPDAEGGGSMIQLLPHRHGVEGFFVARLEKHDG
jgi:16S rRNA (cytosine967-C5)-methyltransferase